jgi:hypothetical protein
MYLGVEELRIIKKAMNPIPKQVLALVATAVSTETFQQ